MLPRYSCKALSALLLPVPCPIRTISFADTKAAATFVKGCFFGHALAFVASLLAMTKW